VWVRCSVLSADFSVVFLFFSDPFKRVADGYMAGSKCWRIHRAVWILWKTPRGQMWCLVLVIPSFLRDIDWEDPCLRLTPSK
jgi:hypothetical protein